MAFIPAPKCVEIVVRFRWAGQTVAITLSFCRDDEVTLPLMTTLINDVADWWITEMADDLSNQISMVAVSARDLTSQDSFVTEESFSQEGLVEAASVPNNATLVITFETGLAGRSFRGRNYVPGIPQGALDNSVTVNADVVADFLSAYGSLPTYVEGDGWNHCVISRYHDKEARSVAASTIVLSYSSDGFLDSQRRRLAGRGE